MQEPSNKKKQGVLTRNCVHINDEITAIVERLVEAVSPEKIYLFGSYARGDYNAESDYDFYVIVQNDRTDILGITQKAYIGLLNMERKPVDIIVNTSERFEEKSNFQSIENTIKQEGILLYA